MKQLFLLHYDNGHEYEDNESYTIAIFDDYEKGIQFILNKGFKPTDTDGLYEKGNEYLYFKKETITIDKVELNVELNYFGETLKEEVK